MYPRYHSNCAAILPYAPLSGLQQVLYIYAASRERLLPFSALRLRRDVPDLSLPAHTARRLSVSVAHQVCVFLNACILDYSTDSPVCQALFEKKSAAVFRTGQTCFRFGIFVKDGSTQYSFKGQPAQSGFLARQVSRPNSTIWWQKREERAGGSTFLRSSSTCSGA